MRRRARLLPLRRAAHRPATTSGSVRRSSRATRTDRVYARGAGDDKGQLFMHLKAVEAWMATAGRLPVNLRFFFEGDEEVGSEPIEAFIDEHADLLRADVCVVSDGDTFDDDGTPAIGYGLRGIAYWEVRVQGPRARRPLRPVRRRRREPGQRRSFACSPR